MDEDRFPKAFKRSQQNNIWVMFLFSLFKFLFSTERWDSSGWKCGLDQRYMGLVVVW